MPSQANEPLNAVEPPPLADPTGTQREITTFIRESIEGAGADDVVDLSGGVDLLSLGDHYETEVRDLATHLCVPEPIVEKPPTAGLREGQTDGSGFGDPCGVIDAVLARLTVAGAAVEETASELGIDPTTVARYAHTVARSEHKRHPPTTTAERTAIAPEEER